jgi:hypothetical protein
VFALTNLSDCNKARIASTWSANPQWSSSMGGDPSWSQNPAVVCPSPPPPPYSPGLAPQPLQQPPPLAPPYPPYLLSLAPAPPGAAYTISVWTQFTLAGNAEDVDLVAFRQSLLAQMQTANPDVDNVVVSIVSGSVVVQAIIKVSSAAAANAVRTKLTTTSASEMASEWFGGSVTVNSVKSPTFVTSGPYPSTGNGDDDPSTGNGDDNTWNCVTERRGITERTRCTTKIDGSTVGIIVGAVGGLVALLVIGRLIWKRKKSCRKRTRQVDSVDA